MRLSGLVLRNLHRHRRSFTFASFGIVLGVSSFVIFLALGQGLRKNVLERVFVVDQVEVVPRRYQMGAVEVSGSLFDSSTGLDQFTLEDIAEIPGVRAVFPKMQISFPSLAWGGEQLFGRNFATEFMAEGIPAELIGSELPLPSDYTFAFRDWDLDRDLFAECDPDGLEEGEECPEPDSCDGAECEQHPYTCSAPGSADLGAAVGCPPGRLCNDQGICERAPCSPADEVLASESQTALREAREYLNGELEGEQHGFEIREVPEHSRMSPNENEYRLKVRERYATDVRQLLPEYLARRGYSERIELALFRAQREALREAGDNRPQRRAQPRIRDARLLDGEEGACVDPPSYCALDTRHCEMPIPIVASPFLMELYNTSIQNVLSGSDRNMPAISPEALIGFTFHVRLGRGYLGRASLYDDVGAAERVFRLVGWTPRAMRLGVTLPFSYARRFNRRYHGDEVGDEFHAILVVADSSERLASIVQVVEGNPDQGGLGLAIAPEYEQAKRGSLLINLLTVGLLFISALIIGLASLNIAHTFLMVIAERERELGILRSVGARRYNILYLVLAEASAVGLVGATFGVLLALGAANVADRLLECRVPNIAGIERWCIPDFPFKPDSFFAFDTRIILAGFAVAVVFSILGAFVPARRASRIDPAEALRAH